MRPARYRKKPVTIEAMQWDGSRESQAAIVNWAEGKIEGFIDDVYYLEVHTLEGNMRANEGDWIIKGVKGEFYPCRNDIFEATYDRVIG